LADRLGAVFDRACFAVVLGGECSILLGPAVAMRRRGRYGVAYLDGHSDFRHPGNSRSVGAAGGEALALVTGRGQADLADLEARAPYVRDVAHSVLTYLCRDQLDGFWVHLDVDILDASVMPAVDSPEPGGLDHAQLRALLTPLLASPGSVGLDVGIFDLDLDPDARLVAELTDTLVAALNR
jgi:arginase